MKILYSNLLPAVLLIFFSPIALADEFCDGFDKGYITGYKQTKGSILDPLTPLCPLEPLKKLSDPDSDFEFGYTLGYKKGVAEGSR